MLRCFHTCGHRGGIRFLNSSVIKLARSLLPDDTTSNTNLNKSKKSSINLVPIPPDPNTCCMSGCANCVWLEYAVELEKYFQDNGEKATEELDKQIDDVSLKTFIKMQLTEKKEDK